MEGSKGRKGSKETVRINTEGVGEVNELSQSHKQFPSLPAVNTVVSPASASDFFLVLPAQAPVERGPPTTHRSSGGVGAFSLPWQARGRGATLRREWGSQSLWPRQTPVSFLSVPTRMVINAKGGGGFNDADTCSLRNGLGSIWHKSATEAPQPQIAFP